MMQKNGNVVSLKQHQTATQQAALDDISAQAFMFLREQAQENKLPMRDVLMEHLLGIALVIKAVEGQEESARVLNEIAQQIDGTNA
ncbi:hypothetical protein FHR99_002821 [Litorivivens lipolytica]|uniref:Uncharacterized protein n=2 Tax=Litorivivens lipolytica TaxID=1524264 RepID=A0A7W4W6V7_9GAMM|nr:hypothetical protein [Litorivivens lipolytica]